MTVKLQLVSLSIVVLSNHVSGIVHILCIFMPYLFHFNSRSIRLFRQFNKVIDKFFLQFFVPIFPEINLIIYNYAQSFGVSGFRNELSYCVYELQIAVRGYAYENLPIIRDGMWLRNLVNYLGKVYRYSIVVILERRKHPVKHLFALKKNGSSQSWSNINDPFNFLSFRI